MKALLKELVETAGVSGDEHRIRDVIRTHVEDHADSIEEDALGNLIARKGSGDKTLMLAAHMDQIGLAVKRVDDEGFIRFSYVGGVSRHSLMNQRVIIHSRDGDYTGVIGMKPIHLMEKEEQEKVPKIKDMFIDIGAADNDAVDELGIRAGDYITFDRDFAALQDDYVTGPAFDNRVGCAVAIEALKRFDADYELAVVFSAQEEVGLKGAGTATFGIDPDVALAIDTSIAGDVPGIKDDESDLKTGGGVEVTMIQSNGRGLLVPESVKNWLIETAEEEDHDLQLGVWEGGATDAARMYITRDGVPTGSIGIPTRHIHSAIEVVKMSDLEDTVAYMESLYGTLEDHF